MVAKKKSNPKKKVAKKAASKTAKKTATKKKVAKKAATKKKTAASSKKKATAKKAAKKTGKKAAKKVAKKTATKKKAAQKTTKKAAKKVAKKAASKPAKSAKKKTGRKSTDRPDIKPYREKSGEDYMNTEQSEHFRNLLNEWKKSLMEEVERTVHHMQDEASNFPDPNDRATQEEEFALELRTRDRERKLIKKINESLVDLESGDYGYCEVCGIEIGVKRLEARPTATLCIDCKTLDEIKEKQLG